MASCEPILQLIPNLGETRRSPPGAAKRACALGPAAWRCPQTLDCKGRAPYPAGAKIAIVIRETQLILPASFRNSICHTCVVRPRCIGRAVPVTQPEDTPQCGKPSGWCGSVITTILAGANEYLLYECYVAFILLPMSRNEEVPVYNRIAEQRELLGMSRQQLAEIVGVHYQTIGYLERGEYSPSLALALRIAEVFEMDVQSLFSIKPFKKGK